MTTVDHVEADLSILEMHFWIIYLRTLPNHPAGRDLMKQCMWKVCPSGEFQARKLDNPSQALLITDSPTLSDLDPWINEQLSGGALRYDDLAEALRDEHWLLKHLNSRLRELRKTGAVLASDYGDRFAFKRNPVLRLPAPED